MDCHFTGIPLQTMMLAEAYENHVSSFQKARNLDLPKNLDLLQLYEKFVNKKVEIYCKEKKKIDITKVGVIDDNEYWHTVFLENHILASVTTLFPPKEFGNLFTIDTKIKMDIFTSKINKGHEKTGIINNVLDGKPQFIHRTFADYFVGMYLSLMFQSSERYHPVHQVVNKYFTNKFSESIYGVMFNHEFYFMRNIFDRILAKDFQLHSAFINQDKSSIKELLSRGVDINSRDLGGRTPLHLAACYCTNIASNEKNAESDKDSEYSVDTFLVELLDQGADINAVDDILQWRPLRYADRITAWDIIEYLLKNNAPIEDLVTTKLEASKRKNRVSILDIAIRRGYVRLLQFVLQTKFSPSEKLCIFSRYEKHRILGTAVHAEQWKILEFIVKNHIDINIKNDSGVSILHWAAGQSNPKAISELVKLGAHINICNNYGNTPLHCAAENGSLSIVQTIISLGGDINIANSDGNTALYLAAGQGMWHVVNHLLHLGSKINIGCSFGNTPLHWAAEKGELNIIRQLVESRADVNIRNNGGNTPLHWAVWKGTKESIGMLVQMGANIDACNNERDTPVYWAAKQSQWNKVEELIKLGAEVNKCNNKGNVPMHWAAKYGNYEIIKRLAELTNVDIKNNYGNAPLHFAASNGKCKLIEQLVELGANVNVQNNTGNTPLHWAVGEDQKETIKLLVKLGAYIEAKNCVGNRALHIAAGQNCKETNERFFNVNMDTSIGKSKNQLVYRFYRNDNVDLVKVLIELGSNRNARNKIGETALHRAASFGNLNVVKYLITMNVEINVRNKYGLTPLDLALTKKKTRQAIIEFLHSKRAVRGSLLSRFILIGK